MTDDIVTRLRNRYCSHGNNYDGAWQPLEWPSSCNRCELDKQAADEIERLRLDAYRWRRVADVCVIALGVPENYTDRLAVELYDKAVRGE